MNTETFVARDPILSARALVKHFPIRSPFLRTSAGAVRGVDGVDIDVYPGETLGIVGESGCGKTTLGRTLIRLLEPTSGRVVFKGKDITNFTNKKLRPLRRDMQFVFQNPFASLDPRMTVHDLIAEPLRVHGRYRSSGGRQRIAELLKTVGLRTDQSKRFPHEFSGGQRQRIGIARALALNPEMLVLDEPVSALDVSIQAQVINLLQDIQKKFKLSYIFIAHDLTVVRHISDRVAVMYLGKVVETGTRDEVYGKPSHPYTQALLSAAPVPNPELRDSRKRILLKGDVPSPVSPPSGCRFRTRCWKAEAICAEQEPPLTKDKQNHPVACHFAESDSDVGLVTTDQLGG